MGGPKKLGWGGWNQGLLELRNKSKNWEPQRIVFLGPHHYHDPHILRRWACSDPGLYGARCSPRASVYLHVSCGRKPGPSGSSSLEPGGTIWYPTPTPVMGMVSLTAGWCPSVSGSSGHECHGRAACTPLCPGCLRVCSRLHAAPERQAVFLPGEKKKWYRDKSSGEGEKKWKKNTHTTYIYKWKKSIWLDMVSFLKIKLWVKILMPLEDS